MKRNYVNPTIEVVEVKIEKGFATSDSYGLQQFEYDQYEGYDPNNSAW